MNTVTYRAAFLATALIAIFSSAGAQSQSAVVSSGTPPAATLPARALATNTLLNDEELTLPDSDRPIVPKAWRLDARARSHAIRSLTSDDDADLRFLDPLLAGKRVVELGESAHGVGEYSLLKVRLIKYLHRRLGFDVIAFESPIGGCAIADAAVSTADPLNVERLCLFGNFASAEVTPLFEYIEQTRSGAHPLHIAGLDPQDYSSALQQVQERRVALVRPLDAALADRLASAQAKADQWVKDYFFSAGKTLPPAGEHAEAVATFEAAASAIERAQASAGRGQPLPGSEAAGIAMSVQDLRGRGALLKTLGQPELEQIAERDRLMADNLDYVLDKAYPGHKVVVWAHNSHIEKHQTLEFKPMGAWVAQRRGAEIYTIGLFMGHGTAATNQGQPYRIDVPPVASIESVLASAGRKVSFVDLSRVNRNDQSSWMRQSIGARSNGVDAYAMIPAATYDGLIYIDSVTPLTFYTK